MKSLCRIGLLIVMLTIPCQPEWATEPKTEARFDQFGDPLPPGAIARLGTIRLRHEDQSSGSVAFTADGKELITSRTRKVVQFWETATGKPLRELRQDDEFGFFVLSANRKILATGGPGDIAIWDTSNAKLVRKIPAKNVEALAITADGRLLAAKGNEKSIRIWDTATGKEQGGLADPTQYPRLFFINDGANLVCVSQIGFVRIWNVATGMETRQFATKINGCAAVSANGRLLAAGGGQFVQNVSEPRVVLWDLATGKSQLRLAVSKHVESMTFSLDDTLLAAATVDGWVSVWEVASGKKLRDFKNAGFRTAHLAFSPDGKTLAAGDQGRDEVIRLWDVATGKGLEPTGPDGVVRTLAFSPDGKFIATGMWGSTGIYLWRADTGTVVGKSKGFAGICQIAFQADGKAIWSASIDGRIRLWQAANSKVIKEYNAGTVVHGFYLFPDEKKLVSVGDFVTDRLGNGGQSVVVWDVETGKRLSELKSRPAFRNLVPLSPDGSMLAQAEGREVHLWNLIAGRKQFSLKVPNTRKGEVLEEAVAFSPDGKTLAAITSMGNSESTIHVWELATGNIIRQITGIKNELVALAFAGDGRTLAVAGTGLVQVRDVATGKELLSYRGYDAQMFLGALAFSPDGTRLATGYCDTTALIWDLKPGTTHAGLRPGALGPKDFDQLWSDLAVQDADKADHALWTLSAVPEKSIPLFQQRLGRVEPAEPQRMRRLLEDLESTTFAIRETASKELKKIGVPAEPMLRALLAKTPSLEVRRRIEKLLARPAFVKDPETLRRIRAVRVLEQIDTKEARQILEEIGNGVSTAPETQDALAALKRLVKSRTNQKEAAP